MEELIYKYTDKLVVHQLVEKDACIFGFLETEISWNRQDEKLESLTEIFGKLNINSLLFAEPKEPYKTIINYLSQYCGNVIYPQDCETRTFLHDLPIINNFEVNEIVKVLKARKSVIIKNLGVMTFGTVSPEQAFVVYSSVCFACFVKFFSDFLTYRPLKQQKSFEKVVTLLEQLPTAFPVLANGPFSEEEMIYQAMDQAGKLTVDFKLVDSYFGNISYRCNNILYISQTSSSLDELIGCIDPCPLDNSSCAGLTASSELSAHKQIVLATENKAILHGHPKFSVILSLFCNEQNCSLRQESLCHLKCPKARFVEDIPIVPGEVGTGQYGLCHTLPPAIKGNRGAIVYGHGLFTVGKNDFNEAFQSLFNVEQMCRQKYFELLAV